MTDISTDTREPRHGSGDTIAAIATAAGQSALSVIRMTGPDSARIADRIFAAAGRSSPDAVSGMPSHTCRFGRVVDPGDGSVLDEVILTNYRAPTSYTGEDMVEISCHGGIAVRRCVLQALLDAGARPAEAGEFSRRAFLNGKMDLSQAESVMDLISSTAERTVRAAAAQLNGALSRQIRDVVAHLYDVIGQLEMSIEYPEHDEADPVMPMVAGEIARLDGEVRRLHASYRQGRMLKEGLTVVIAGRPNVGKSSLLNRLTGYDRAIVTELAGTTRDTVEAHIEIRGLPVRLVDTAGLRETEDRIEREGIDRARSAVAGADLVLWVTSPEEEEGYPVGQEAADILRAARQTPLVVVAGKGDGPDGPAHRARIETALRDAADLAPEVIPFSAVTGDGLDAVRDRILQVYEQAGPADTELVLLNERHARATEAAADKLAEAAAAALALAEERPAVPADMVSLLLQSAAEHLATITGDRVSDRIVDTIFSRFCVGK